MRHASARHRHLRGEQPISYSSSLVQGSCLDFEMDVRIASRIAAGKNRREGRIAHRVGYADGAQIGGVRKIVD